MNLNSTSDELLNPAFDLHKIKADCSKSGYGKLSLYKSEVENPCFVSIGDLKIKIGFRGEKSFQRIFTEMLKTLS